MRTREREREKIPAKIPIKIPTKIPTKHSWASQGFLLYFFMKQKKKRYPPSQLGRPGILGTSGI
jgi:hypothetical protein